MFELVLSLALVIDPLMIVELSNSFSQESLGNTQETAQEIISNILASKEESKTEVKIEAGSKMSSEE